MARKERANARSGEDSVSGVSAEEIQARAYEIYERRGCTPGRDLDDWLEAEAELTRERSKP